ncbi:MAG: hypothetical protein AB7O92_21665 [Acidimicrobiia bacterium]
MPAILGGADRSASGSVSPPATRGPGCTIPADLYIVCSVIVRAASGEGIVNVAFLSRLGQPDLLVAGFTIEVPWPSFTG